MSEQSPAVVSAVNAARALEQKTHTYKTDNESLMAECACGVTAPVHDIGVHIEKAAAAAGESARLEAEKQ